ncbi:unnamed protein product, partial [Ectocarpus sp. 12 AP-2014]
PPSFCDGCGPHTKTDIEVSRQHNNTLQKHDSRLRPTKTRLKPAARFACWMLRLPMQSTRARGASHSRQENTHPAYSYIVLQRRRQGFRSLIEFHGKAPPPRAKRNEGR